MNLREGWLTALVLQEVGGGLLGWSLQSAETNITAVLQLRPRGLLAPLQVLYCTVLYCTVLHPRPLQLSLDTAAARLRYTSTQFRPLAGGLDIGQQQRGLARSSCTLCRDISEL